MPNVTIPMNTGAAPLTGPNRAESISRYSVDLTHYRQEMDRAAFIDTLRGMLDAVIMHSVITQGRKATAALIREAMEAVSLESEATVSQSAAAESRPAPAQRIDAAVAEIRAALAEIYQTDKHPRAMITTDVTLGADHGGVAIGASPAPMLKARLVYEDVRYPASAEGLPVS